MHPNSNSSRHNRLAQKLEYALQAIEIFSGYLPPGLRRVARRTCAGSALAGARRMAQIGDRTGLDAHLKVGLRFSRSAKIVLADRVLMTSLAMGKPRHGA